MTVHVNILRNKTIYLCDKKKTCHTKKSCSTMCNHTLDKDHAVNGGCLVPTLSPRFSRTLLDNYIEREDDDSREIFAINKGNEG